MAGDAALLDATPAYAAKVNATTPPRKLMTIGETGARYNMCDRVPMTDKCHQYTGTPTEMQVRGRAKRITPATRATWKGALAG
jgi:hypothetical protein